MRRRRARGADHAQGGGGRNQPAAAHRANRRGPPPLSRGLSLELRSLALDRLARERRVVAGRLPAAEERGPHLPEAGRAVLRSGEGHVPAGPVHQGRVPELPCEGAVRGRVRGMQHRQYADAARQPVLDPHRGEAGAEDLGSLLLQAVRAEVRPLPRGMAGSRGAAAAAGGQQGPRVAHRQGRPGARGLGHLARCAVLRHSDPRRAGQVLLRLARRADRLPRRAQELLRARQGAGQRRAAQLRGVPRRSGHRADPLHRQGHHLLPYALLARDAEVRRRALPRPQPRVRSRLHHRIGREDVEIARYRHQPAALSRPRHERRVAALLHRRQAERQRRGPRLQPR